MLKSDLFEDGNLFYSCISIDLNLVKIRPLGGWKFESCFFKFFYEYVKIRPLGGWKWGSLKLRGWGVEFS